MKKTYTCIVCPMSCRITVEEQEEGMKVAGNGCGRGKEYAMNEHTLPKRTLKSGKWQITPSSGDHGQSAAKSKEGGMSERNLYGLCTGSRALWRYCSGKCMWNRRGCSGVPFRAAKSIKRKKQSVSGSDTDCFFCKEYKS